MACGARRVEPARLILRLEPEDDVGIAFAWAAQKPQFVDDRSAPVGFIRGLAPNGGTNIS